jgi:hypothetical protein
MQLLYAPTEDVIKLEHGVLGADATAGSNVSLNTNKAVSHLTVDRRTAHQRRHAGRGIAAIGCARCRPKGLLLLRNSQGINLTS